MEANKVPVIHLQMVRENAVPYKGSRIRTAEDAAKLAKIYLGDRDREHMVICCLDAKGKPTLLQTVGIGTVNECMFSVPDIYKAAILSNAKQILLFHNHPSGNPSPSDDDIVATESIRRAGELLGVELADHIILGEGEDYYSFRESRQYWYSEKNAA